MNRHAPVVIVTALFALACTAVPSLADGVFSGFGGAWRGKGTISLTDGSREAIRCRAAYGVRSDGNALSVDVDCASDSYRVHILASVVARGSCSSSARARCRRC